MTFTPRIAFARIVPITLAMSVVLLGGCASGPTAVTAQRETPNTSTARAATVLLASASGSLVSGRLNAAPMGNGVHFVGEIGGLGKGGTHAIHIHEKGDCSAADASSAGAHFNPAGKSHGKVESGSHHAGDMNNIVADRNGVAQVNVHAAGVSLGGSSRNDIAGRAVIVHAAPDDYATQPTGNAGGRVACGIITVQR